MTPSTNSQRTFGIELEIYKPMGLDLDAVFNSINVEYHYEGYNHTTRAHWKGVYDSSLNGGAPRGFEGIEIVSPVLRGTAGLEEAAKVAAALDAAGCTVRKQCGFHVHVGAEDLTHKAYMRVLWNYAKYETAIDTVMPVSRRANNSTWCRSVMTYGETANDLFRRLERTDNDHDLADSQQTRYRKVNAHAKVRQNTIEFRHHSGTVNADKIVAWVKFCLAFVDRAPSSRPRFINNMEVARKCAWGDLFNYLKDADLKAFYSARRKHFKALSRRRRA